MNRINAVLPILSGFLCGYHLSDLAWRIDSGAGVHGATDLMPWLIVPVTGIYAVVGGVRAFKDAKPAAPPK